MAACEVRESLLEKTRPKSAGKLRDQMRQYPFTFVQGIEVEFTGDALWVSDWGTYIKRFAPTQSQDQVFVRLGE